MSIQRLAAGLTLVNLVLLVALLAGALRGPEMAAANRPPEQSVAPVLRGRALEIVDERGVLRTRLNVEAGGEVVLRMIDQKGAIRVKLGAGEDGSGLLLADEAAEPGIHLIARRTATADRPNTTSLTLRTGTRQHVVRP